MGKAIKKPAKDTIMSFAASQEGVGKSFGIQEVLDQIGAFLGPVLLYVVMLLKTDGTTFQVYATCFAVLAIPGAITLILLLMTRRKFPNPEHFEPEPKEYVPFHMKKEFILYIAGISCLPSVHRLFHHHHARVPDLHRCGGGPAGNGKSDLQRNAAPAVCRGHAGGRGGGPVLRAAV